MVEVALLVWVGVALFVFVIGCAWRGWRYVKAPVHLRWDLYPVAHEPAAVREHGGSYLEEKEWWTKPQRRSLLGEVTTMAEEIVLLRGVWENNRRLWWGSVPFHWGLYLLVIATLGMALLAAGLTAPAVATLVSICGGIGGLFLAVGAMVLLVLRTVDPKLVPYTTPVDRLNLGLLATFGILSAALVLSESGVAGVAELLTAAAHGRPGTVSALVGAQMAIGGLFLCYLPFTRMVHFFAKYFTYHEVRWDDAPRKAGSRMSRRLQAALDYGVDWSADHVGAGRSWAEVATSPPGTDDEGGK